ncbi:MAG: hypothetical protein JW837_03605 [Sedimentisphaerales bacterium]|nr:hypothetical protein [Sedimentisphaerales bacterium]
MNKQEIFNTLKTYLAGERSYSAYRDVAIVLNMTEKAVKTMVYRLRKRYREILREEIAQTVTTHDQVDEEIQVLFTALTD